MEKSKLILCKEHVKIGGFEIRYVYADPLPQHIQFLLQNRLEGLDFVKIPINEKEDRLYLIRQIKILLNQTQIPGDIIDKLIKDYNAPVTISSSDEVRELNLKSRNMLSCIVKLAQYISELKNTEFLTI
jgi:hypothetical protein